MSFVIRGVRHRQVFLLFTVGGLVLNDVQVNGQHTCQLGDDEGADRQVERRSVPVAELRFVHRRFRFVPSLFRNGTDVSHDTDQRAQTCTGVNSQH